MAASLTTAPADAHVPSHALLRELVESAPDGLIVVDARGLMVLANKQAERLFGHPRADLVGQPVEMLVPHRFRGVHPGHRGGFLANPKVRGMGAGLELFGLRKDGTEFPVEISLSPIVTDEGRLASAAIRDVTDRKRAEAKFRGLLESAPDAMVIVDAGGTIVLVNAQTERLFGHSRAELLGQKVEKLIPPRFAARHPGHREGYSDEPRVRSMGAGLELYGLRRTAPSSPSRSASAPSRRRAACW